MFSKLKDMLPEILLTPDRKHGTIFEKILIIWFERAISLKQILMTAKVAPLEKTRGYFRLCGDTRCDICKHVATTKTFRFFSTNGEHCIKPDNLNRRNVEYLFLCKACSKQYTGSAQMLYSTYNLNHEMLFPSSLSIFPLNSKQYKNNNFIDFLRRYSVKQIVISL